jgi:hypothetical protein
MYNLPAICGQTEQSNSSQIKPIPTLFISKNALAKTVNISQSQISNWSNYGLKRWTKNSKRLDDYIT